MKSILSDKDGQFEFTNIPRIDSTDWGWVFYSLVSEASDHAFGVATLRNDTPQSGLVLEMGKPETILGRVVDLNGKPVSEATVWIAWMSHGVLPKASSDNMILFAARNDLLSARTNANGVFELRRLPAHGSLLVRAEAPHHARNEVFHAGPDNILFKLGPGSSVTGMVTYHDARPASSVSVTAEEVGRGSRISATTDERGQYRIESLREGKYNIWTDVDGWTAKGLADFTVEAGISVEAPNLVLVRGAWITGRIIDGNGGLLVRPGKLLYVGLRGPSRPLSGKAFEPAAILADGSFRIRAAPGRNYICLRFEKDWLDGEKSVDVEAGKTATMDLVFVNTNPRGR